MLLIIGLDGATWDLLDPWIDEGRLPHLAALRCRSLWGPLASTVPAATLPSWSTFMTGVNPGKHGIFDFTRRQLGSYGVTFVNASMRKVPSVWKLLSVAGRRVCVLGLPGTYPPEAVNGCMVSGFDTPVTTRADDSFVTPPELAPLVKDAGGFPFADFQEFRVNRRWYRRALDRLLRGIETKVRLGQTLLQREAWDCFLLLFGESDTVAHHFWKFHDPLSPRFDAGGAAEFGDAIRTVYERLDEALGTLLRSAPGATVLLASDHGFGGAGKKVVHLNHWLQRAGWQRATRSRRTSVLSAGLKRVALQSIPPQAQARLFRWNGGQWANRLESWSRLGGIDWAGTRAFSEELNYFPSVWLNLKGREPQGVVDPADYERVRDDICAGAAALVDPEHGAPVVRRAWRREEVYQGAWIKYAPDIILEFQLDRGYSYPCAPSPSPSAPTIRFLEADENGGGKLAGMNGSHRPQGIFLVTDAGRREQRREGVHIADMAPTILEHCGVEVPAYMDGHAIDARLRGTRSWPVRLPEVDSERPYGRAEEGEIAARLTALGYLQ